MNKVRNTDPTKSTNSNLRRIHDIRHPQSSDQPTNRPRRVGRLLSWRLPNRRVLRARLVTITNKWTITTARLRQLALGGLSLSKLDLRKLSVALDPHKLDFYKLHPCNLSRAKLTTGTKAIHHHTKNFLHSPRAVIQAVLVLALVLSFVQFARAITPTITTQAVTNLDWDKATLNGQVNDDHGEQVTATGFEYGPDTNYGDTTQATADHKFSSIIGGNLANGAMNRPGSITTDSAGNVYVADTYNHRIQKFNSSGTFITKWGNYGSGDGQFDYPQGLTTDSAGNVYVADRDNHRIQKFGSTGTFIAKWGGRGATNGKFNSPTGITTDSAGNVYVADTNNHRIQKFDSSGTYISQWGTSGSGDGRFSYPQGLTIDSAGNVYVADSNNSRIQKFDSAGTFITKWGTNGSGNGQFNSPQGLTTDSAGNVYVADTNNHRIQKFDSSGTFITKWGSQGSGDGQFDYPQGITTDSAGNVYVADTYNHRIQKFDSAGTFITKWGTNGSGNGQFNSPQGLTTDSAGNVYVADTYNYRIQKFDSSGTFITKWGTNGSGNGQFNSPTGITTDSAGNVYVADTNNHRIQKFDSSGTFITKWGNYGSGNGQFSYPQGLTTDSAGNVYVADSGNRRIQKFDSSGTFITKWGTNGSGNGQFNSPQGLTTDSAGNVYVADTYNYRIQKFDSSGTFITKWGTNGSGNGQFNSPTGLTTDSAGNVYVADRDNSRIQKFNSSGTFITKWGTNGSGNGQFNSPQGLTTDSAGNVYVADRDNHRIQKFTLVANSDTFSSQIENLSCDTSYHYRAYATNASGTSYGTDQVFTTPSCVPLAPSNLRVEVQSFNSIEVVWDRPDYTGSAGIDHYIIYYRKAGTGSWQQVSSNNDAESVIVSGLEQFTSYDMKVSAVNYDGHESPATAEVSETTPRVNFGLVRNCQDLQNINNNLNVSYELVNDIDCSDTINWNAGAGFVPLGGCQYDFYSLSEPTPFKGILAGNNHVIAGLYADTTASPGCVTAGLFGNTRGALVQDLKLTDPVFKGGYVGLVATANNTDITNVQVYNGAYDGTSGFGGGGIAGFMFFDDAASHDLAKNSFTGSIVASCDTSTMGMIGGLYSYLVAFGQNTINLHDSYADADISVNSANACLGGSGIGGGIGYIVAGNTAMSVNNIYAAGSQNVSITENANGQFDYPQGLTTDSAGNVYVADTDNHRIQKFDSSGTFITKWGSQGSGDGQFNNPSGLTIDNAGNVYVADRDNHRIQKFDSAGTYLTQWGTGGSGDGQFNNPSGLTTDSAGNVYVADRNNSRIQKFDSAGTYLTQWGTGGSGDGQFNNPSGLTIDNAGNVYVADTYNHRIQKFNSAGTYISQWGTNGSGDGQFNQPQGLTIDNAGNVYVADTYNHRIQKFNSAGTYISQWGTNGSGDGQFNQPQGLTTDSAGNVYVADRDNHRIQKFNSSGTYISQWGSQGYVSWTNIGGLIGVANYYSASNSLTNSFAHVAQTINVGDQVAGALVGAAYYDTPPTITGNYADTTLAGRANCFGGGESEDTAKCTGIAGQPNYFYNNHTNPPLDQWNFTDLWETTPTLPVFSAVAVNTLTPISAERLARYNPPVPPTPTPVPATPISPSPTPEPTPDTSGSRSAAITQTTNQTPPPPAEPGGILGVLKDIVRAIPEPVLRSFPYVVVGLMGLLSLAMLFEMYRQSRRLAQLNLLLAKQAKVAEDRDTFWHLAANYLRSPITLLVGSVDLMTDSSPKTKAQPTTAPAKLTLGLTSLVHDMQTKVMKIMDQIETSQSLQAIRWPARTQPRHLLTNWRFWVPLTVTGLLIALSNYVAQNFRNIEVSTLNLAVQALLFIVVTIAIYWVVGALGLTRSKVTRAQTQLDRQAKDLDKARMQLIDETATVLSSDITRLDAMLAKLPAKEPMLLAMQEGSRRLHEIVSSFQQLILAQNNRLDTISPASASTDLSQAIDSSLNELAATIKSKDITVVQSGTIAGAVPGSEPVIKRVIGSILENAIQFSPRGGQVTIQSQQTGSGSSVTITDKGPGVSKTQQAHIFQLFTKADGKNALQMDHDGLGVDLYLDKQIMQHLQGGIDLQTSSHGTAVTLTWPAVG